MVVLCQCRHMRCHAAAGSPATGEVLEVSLPLVTPVITRGLNVDNTSTHCRPLRCELYLFDVSRQLSEIMNYKLM